MYIIYSLLVESILSDGSDRKVEQSFSRRRGFRNRIKRTEKKIGESSQIGLHFEE